MDNNEQVIVESGQQILNYPFSTITYSSKKIYE